MASKKIQIHVRDGGDLWFEDYESDICVWVREAMHPGERGQYILTQAAGCWGKLPHKTRSYLTLDDLEAGMRQLQPDLRKWRYAMG